MKLTENQIKVLRELCKRWEFKISHSKKLFYSNPRPSSIIAGPTGVGKSALIGEFCRLNKLPLITLTPSTWIVEGANSEIHTLRQVAQFVERHERGIIFLDEINKIRPEHLSQTWSMSVLNELLSLLDCDQRLVTGSTFNVRLVEKLNDNFFVVAGGAWQDEWESSRKSATTGFCGSVGGEIDVEEFKRKIQGQDAIPEELFSRFNSDILFLLPPTKKEMRARLRAVYKEINRPIPSSKKLTELVSRAFQTNSPLRWLESHVLQLLTKTLPQVLQKHSAKHPSSEDLELERCIKEYSALPASIKAIAGKLCSKASALSLNLHYKLSLKSPTLSDKLGQKLTGFAMHADKFYSPLASEDEVASQVGWLKRSIQEILKIIDEQRELISQSDSDTIAQIAGLASTLNLINSEILRLQDLRDHPDRFRKKDIADKRDAREEW